MKKIILLSTILLALVFAFQACNNEEETPDPVTPDPPVISDFTPKTGGEGTEVTITGSNFTADAEVTFADNKGAAVTFVSATELTATVPADAVTGKIKVSIEGVEVESVEDFTVENAPPSAFNLVAVADEATEIDLQPTFEWEAATDPEGGAVTYEIFLDQTEDPTTSIAADLTGTTYELTERLSLIENYNWKVVATDEQGNETSSDVFSFETRTIRFPEQAVVTSADFGTRASHSFAIFDNKMWIVAGGSGVSNDVWSSGDGENWTLATDDAGFEERDGQQLISFNGKLWIIGGSTNLNYRLNDVWSSTDGITWVEETENANFPVRYRFTALTYDDKMWVIGGDKDNTTELNDVWSSTDGQNWTQTTSDAGFQIRSGHISLVFDNKMWVIGGDGQGSVNYADAWYSNDGITWTEATDNAAFGTIRLHSGVVFDDKMWVIGGEASGSRTNKIWYTNDGIEWLEAVQNIPFKERDRHTTVVYDDKVWIIGGVGLSGAGAITDVWYFD